MLTKNMKIGIGVVAGTLLLMACGKDNHGDSGGTTVTTAHGAIQRINSWRSRECYSLPFLQSGYTDVERVKQIREQVKGYVNLVQEPAGEDYWQTSCETMQRGEGDCEDIAILIYRYMREAEFDDNMIGILITYFNNNPAAGYHLVPYFYYDDTLYVVDQWRVEKFNGTVLMTFNAFEIKNYGL